MTRDEKIIRNKVGVLELAKQLGSVSQACRIMGFSRDSFYRFKELYEKGGEAALIEMSRRVPNPKNRVAEAVEQRILELVLEQPAWGHTRMANELAREGIRVSPTGVRGVLVRHDLNTMAKRLKGLEAKMAVTGRSGPPGWVGGRCHLFSRIGLLMDSQQLPQVFDAGVSECHEALVVDAVDVDEAVLGFQFDGDLMKLVLVLAEHFGDAGEGEDVGDRGHAQAA